MLEIDTIIGVWEFLFASSRTALACRGQFVAYFATRIGRFTPLDVVTIGVKMDAVAFGLSLAIDEGSRSLPTFLAHLALGLLVQIRRR